MTDRPPAASQPTSGEPRAAGRGMHKNRTGYTGSELRTRLRNYDRSPFIELLAGWLECIPSQEAVRAFARRSPDKYAASLVQIAQLAGYTAKTESTMNVNIAVAIGQLSDSQIEDRLALLAQQGDILRTIDVPSREIAAPALQIETPTAAPNTPEPSASATDDD